MLSSHLAHYLVAAGAAFVAGVVNSVAGGGTLLTFPTLLWLGLPSVIANATNTAAIWPGSIGSMWGFRREISETEPKLRWLAIPASVGGLAGAFVLRHTPSSLFDRIVPFLILFATLLFTVQGPIQKRLRERHGASHHSRNWFIGAVVLQMVVGFYGGYFGAGMSIMMLSTLGLLGMDDILKMSGLTSFFALCVNGVALILFIAAHMVYWPYVFVMMFAALLGGYLAAGLARRIGKVIVRRCVIAVGFTITVVMFIKML